MRSDGKGAVEVQRRRADCVGLERDGAHQTSSPTRAASLTTTTRGRVEQLLQGASVLSAGFMSASAFSRPLPDSHNRYWNDTELRQIHMGPDAAAWDSAWHRRRRRAVSRRLASSREGGEALGSGGVRKMRRARRGWSRRRRRRARAGGESRAGRARERRQPRRARHVSGRLHSRAPRLLLLLEADSPPPYSSPSSTMPGGIPRPAASGPVSI